MASSPPPRTSSSTPRTVRPRSSCLWIILVGALLLFFFCSISGAFTSVLIGGTVLPGSTMPSSGGSAGVSLGTSPAQSASAEALDFMQDLKGHSYLQAYHDLGDTLLIALSADDFAHQAALADSCAGPVTAFQRVQSRVEEQGTAQFTYRVIRSKQPGGYSFSLALQQDGQGKWAVTDYGKGEHLAPPGVAACG